MNLTAMLTLRNMGEILGKPRFTYVTPEASQDTRALYQQAVAVAMNAYSPLPLSGTLGRGDGIAENHAVR